MSKSTKSKAKEKTNFHLAVINQHAAAIDVGSMLLMVAFTDASGEQKVMECESFTPNLHAMAQTLKMEHVTHVAMEATGVYWMALYEILQKEGMQVTLINPKHFKNVDAQKTDVKDAQWLHQLHAHGLLRASHVAPELFRELRGYLHERNTLQIQKSDTLNRIHRLLTKMNIKFQHVISDIEGVAGMKLLRAIASGIKDPNALLSSIEPLHLKATPEDMLKSLVGIYADSFILILQHQLKAYDFFKEQMKEYEALIERVLQRIQPDQTPVKPKTIRPRKNQYGFNLKDYLHRIMGVDLTKVDGFSEISILEIVSVTGTDLSKWKTDQHFTSWLNLSPRPKITGGKLIGYTKRFTNNKATQSFRLAAQALWKNKGTLGKLYRRLAAQKGSAKANKALARKLAVIFYHMVRNKTEFDPLRIQIDSEKDKARKITRLRKEAARYGLKITEAA